jgi:hypothetical protein
VKLEGSLDAFGLPDIFQLLSYTKKTGGLHLRNATRDGVVYFALGAVTGATADTSRQLLARRIVGSGAVDDDALASAVRRAGDDGVGVARALVDAGAVDADLVRTAGAEQAVEAVFDLLGWTQGDFSFSVDEGNPDDVGVELATEQVVGEATQRRAAVAEQGDGVPAAAVLAMPVAPPPDASITAEEWQLLALADGHRSVADVVELTGQSSYVVTAALAGMLGRGLLQVSDGGSDHASTVRRRLDLLAPLETAPSASDAGSAPAPASAPAAAPASPASSAPAAAAPAVVSMAPAAPAPLAATVAAPPAPTAAAPVASAPPEAPAPTAPIAATEVVEPAPPAADRPADGEVTRHLVATIGGPHVPTDVVPERPEPFIAARQPEHPEQPPGRPGGGGFGTPAPAAPAPSRPVFDSPRPPEPSRPAPVAPSAGTVSSVGGVNGSAAMAPDPEAAAVIERDPSVNRSLLLRLIAGVRGL